jgi:lactate permease
LLPQIVQAITRALPGDEFTFGAFLEGAAGIGAPVAIAGAMLAGPGIDRFRASGLCLLANTAPVAFGSLAIPIDEL